MEIPDNILKDLQFYLIRSVFWRLDKEGNRHTCCNIVAEEAEYGSEMGIRAMEARTAVLELLRTKTAEPCGHEDREWYHGKPCPKCG